MADASSQIYYVSIFVCFKITFHWMFLRYRKILKSEVVSINDFRRLMPTVHADAGRSSALNDPVFTLCLHCTSPLGTQEGEREGLEGRVGGKEERNGGNDERTVGWIGELEPEARLDWRQQQRVRLRQLLSYISVPCCRRSATTERAIFCCCRASSWSSSGSPLVFLCQRKESEKFKQEDLVSN